MFYVNGSKRTAQELISEFNIPIPKKEYGIFELHESQVRKDRVNGGIKYSIEKRVSPVFRATHPQTHEDIEIAYSERTPSVDKKTEMVTYYPRKVAFEGHRMRVDLKKNLEKYILFFLYPSCEDSPFSNGGEIKWKVFDSEKTAKKANLYDEALTEALAYIKNGDYEDLKNRAKGLGMSTYELSEAEIKQGLREVAKKDPSDFILKITDNTIEWKGRIKDAIDTGIFETKVINGMPRWFWGKGEKAGQEICIIDKGQDHFEFLLAKITDQFDVVYNQLNTIQKKSSTDKKIKDQLDGVTPEDNPTKEKVMKLLERSLIYLDAKTRTVHWMNAGEVGEEIAKVEDVREWVNELCEIFDKNEELGKKLKYKYSPIKNK